ncbi:MAG: ImmA/IrrE family metallo-endopeptidase [Phycisphaerales bacterium]
MSLTADFIKSLGASTALQACELAVEQHVRGIASPGSPLNLHAVARSMGIAIVHVDGMAWEGMIEFDAWNETISLRKGGSLRRERFTLAHELGHAIIRRLLRRETDSILFRGPSVDRKDVAEEERLANLLAAELLLPSCDLKTLLDFDLPVANQVRALCRQYQVSRIAALRRISDVFLRNFLTLEITPSRFHKLDSDAEVDDAIFITAGVSTLYARESTTLSKRIAFSDLKDVDVASIEIDSPKGELHLDAEIDYSSNPIPHVYAIAHSDQCNW